MGSSIGELSLFIQRQDGSKVEVHIDTDDWQVEQLKRGGYPPVLYPSEIRLVDRITQAMKHSGVFGRPKIQERIVAGDGDESVEVDPRVPGMRFTVRENPDPDECPGGT